MLDLLIGDPVYPAHPIRLMGNTLTWFENALRKLGADGYGGGIALFFLLSIVWVGGSGAVLFGLQKWSTTAAATFHLFLAYSCLALHDLLRHSWAVESVARRGDLEGARKAISQLVGRDTEALRSHLPGAPAALDALTSFTVVDASRLDALAMPVAGCGQLIGSDAEGRGVAVRVVGPDIDVVNVVGELYLAQQVALRAIAKFLNALLNVILAAAAKILRAPLRSGDAHGFGRAFRPGTVERQRRSVAAISILPAAHHGGRSATCQSRKCAVQRQALKSAARGDQRGQVP